MGRYSEFNKKKKHRIKWAEGARTSTWITCKWKDDESSKWQGGYSSHKRRDVEKLLNRVREGDEPLKFSYYLFEKSTHTEEQEVLKRARRKARKEQMSSAEIEDVKDQKKSRRKDKQSEQAKRQKRRERRERRKKEKQS